MQIINLSITKVSLFLLVIGTFSLFFDVFGMFDKWLFFYKFVLKDVIFFAVFLNIVDCFKVSLLIHTMDDRKILNNLISFLLYHQVKEYRSIAFGSFGSFQNFI